MEDNSNQYNFEKRYEKKLSTLKAYAEVFLKISNILGLFDHRGYSSAFIPILRSSYIIYFNDINWEL